LVPVLEGFARGLAAFLGLTLVAAGAIKLVQLELTRRSLIRLLPTRRRRPPRTLLAVVAVALGTGELGFGVILVVAPTTPVIAGGAVLLCAGFVAVVTIAQRRGAACGCFGSFSVRASGPVESARALALLGTSVVLFAGTVTVTVAGQTGSVSLAGFAAGLAAAAAAVGLAIVAAGGYRSPRAALGAMAAAVSVFRSGSGWRPALPWERRRIKRTVRSHASVRDVEDRAPVAFGWRWAKVRLTGRPVRVASVVVPGRGARLHILLPASGPLAVVCYSPAGVIAPRRIEGAHAGGAARPVVPPGARPSPAPAPGVV
jgi:hypothetical protein